MQQLEEVPEFFIVFTPPNSTSGWRDGELKFLYHMGISQSVSTNYWWNLQWQFRHEYAGIRVKIWWIINTHALLSKGLLAWCPAPNYDSRLYTLMHTSNAIERPYNNDNTSALVCTTPCNHIFVYCTILWRYLSIQSTSIRKILPWPSNVTCCAGSVYALDASIWSKIALILIFETNCIST